MRVVEVEGVRRVETGVGNGGGWVGTGVGNGGGWVGTVVGNGGGWVVKRWIN